MKSEFLRREPRRLPDTVKHFKTGDESRDQIFAAEFAALRNREARHGERRARMHADAWLAQRIQLKGVRRRAVGEARKRRAQFDAGAYHIRSALGTVAFGVIDHRLRPWHLRAQHARTHGVDQAVLGALHGLWRDLFKRKAAGELRKRLAGGGHGVPLCSAMRCGAYVRVRINSTRQPCPLLPHYH